MSTIPGSFAYVHDGVEHPARRIREAGDALREQTAAGSVVRLTAASGLDLLSAIAGLEGWASRVELVPAGTEPARSAADPGWSHGDETGWVVFSSGSTGEPKPVTHTLASLGRGVRTQDGARIWALVYEPSRLAGLAVILQAVATGSRLVDARHGTIAERVATMRSGGVTAVSATPTLWRQILQSGETDGWALERITLGGEVADQRILDALATRFPGARITHVFATSETGVAFAVGDGLAGFPARYLEEAPRGIRLQLRDGALWVENPGSSAAGPDGFAPTDDAVEVRGDRVHFAGRISGMTNVGGTKVFPEQVERVLRDHPDVADAVVSARPNPFSGQILVATVTPARTGIEHLGPAVRRWAAERLPAPMVPATIDVVEALPSTPTGKAVRP